MAQNYGVDIQRWNGQDYDTILPTPDAHASTHQADGSDPVVLQTGNYGNGTITKQKLASGATYTSIAVTLTTANWSSNAQTVNAAGVTASNAVIVSAAPASYLSYSEFGVYCSAQGAGTLTFTCDSTPDVNLTVNVLIPT